MAQSFRDWVIENQEHDEQDKEELEWNIELERKIGKEKTNPRRSLRIEEHRFKTEVINAYKIYISSLPSSSKK